MLLVWVIAWFVVIFGINTTSDILKFSYVAVRRVKLETILEYHKWYLCQISRTIHAIIWLYYKPQRFCSFYLSVFQIKLKYHCSNHYYRNFSYSSIIGVTNIIVCHFRNKSLHLQNFVNMRKHCHDMIKMHQQKNQATKLSQKVMHLTLCWFTFSKET